MPYCLVTGTAGLPNGAVFSNGSFTASRAPKVTSGYEGRAVIPDAVTFVSDAAGYIEVSLMPGSYQVSEATTNNKFMLFVPEQATADFTDCVEAASIVLTPSMVQDVFDARDAAEAAAATIASSFATRAEFITWAASSTVEDGTVASASGVQYVKTTGATAIPDAVGWLPFGDWDVRHWDCVGGAMTSDAPPVGASVDEASKIQTAFDAALQYGKDLYGAEDRVFGVSSSVVWGKRSGGPTVLGSPTLYRLRLQALSGVWTTGSKSDADPANWAFGVAVLYVGSDPSSTGKYRTPIYDVSVNAARLAAVGIHFLAVTQCTNDGGAYRAKEAQVAIGPSPSGDDGKNCTDGRFSLRGSEFQFTSDLSDGYNDLTVRTGVGLYVSSSDVEISDTTMAPSLHGLVLAGGFNAQITDSKFWNGPVRTDTNSRTVWIGPQAHNYFFTGCRFDDGRVFLQSFDGKWNGNEQIQFSFSDALQFDATTASETAEALVMVGNVFLGTAVSFTASGSGSWGTFAGKFVGNKNTNDGFLTADGYAANIGTQKVANGSVWLGDLELTTSSGDYSQIKGNRSLLIMADYDNNSGTTQSYIDFGADATVFHRIQSAGNWLFGYGQATSAGSIASFNWSGDKFRITPSDGAGGTSFANRLEYDPATSTWGFYGEVAQYGSDHGFVGAGFSSRAAFVTWASGKTFTNGTVVTAARRQYRYSSGATDISDLPNWLPFGPVYPDHFGYNAIAGTTDMTAAILAAATYVKNTFTSGGTVWGSDNVYAVSAPIDVSGFFGVRFEGLNLIAIGTWTSGDPMFLISTASAASRVDMSFINCNFEGAQKANGIKIKNYSRVLVKNCKMHGVPLYAVKTDTSAGELMIDGCQFRQYYNGESGWATAANRTAKLIDISTPDAIVINTVAAYGQYPVYVSGGFNHIQFIGCHFYDGGYTPGAGQPYSGYFDAKDMQVVGNYFDSGIVRVVAGSTGVFSANHFYKSGSAINTNGIEFYNTGASANLAGLTISNNTSDGFPDYTYPVLFTGVWDTNLQMIGGSNATASGRPWAGLPLLGTGNSGIAEVKDDAFVWFSNSDATAKARLGLGSVPSGTTTTYFLPNVGGNLLVNNGSATISGQWTVVSNFTINDQNFILRDGADNTKKASFELSGITTGTTRTYTLPDATGTLALNTVFSSGANGLTPASGGGTTNFLRADGTWAAPSGGGGGVTDGDKGDIIVSGTGTVWSLDYTAVNATIAPTWANITSKPAAVTSLSGTNTGDQTITLTGDVTGSGTGSFAATLATVNSNVGSFGSSTTAPTFTVNAKGLITAASSVTITPAWSSLTGTPVTVSGYGITDAVTTSGDQTVAGVKTFSSQIVASGATTDPASPADGSIWFDSQIMTPKFQAGGRTFDLYASLMKSSAMVWSASPGAAAPSTFGLAAPTAVGTLTAASIATTNIHTYLPRVEALVTVAATTAIAGFRGTNNVVSCGGPSASLGGFKFTIIWGPATGVATTTNRAFMGLANITSAPTDVEPSTVVSGIWMGWDAADTNIQMMFNDASGTATKVNLGASFPVPTSDRTKVYMMELYCPKGTTQSCQWRVTDLGGAVTAQGTQTTDLPTTTTLLAPRGWMSVGGTSSVIGLSLYGMFLNPMI